MDWQALLVVIVVAAVLVGVAVAVLWILSARREAIKWRARHAAAVDVIARLQDRVEIKNLGDGELHDAVFEILGEYSPVDPAGDSG